MSMMVGRKAITYLADSGSMNYEVADDEHDG